jgi:hypothetical protein
LAQAARFAVCPQITTNDPLQVALHGENGPAPLLNSLQTYK